MGKLPECQDPPRCVKVLGFSHTRLRTPLVSIVPNLVGPDKKRQVIHFFLDTGPPIISSKRLSSIRASGAARSTYSPSRRIGPNIPRYAQRVGIVPLFTNASTISRLLLVAMGRETTETLLLRSQASPMRCEHHPQVLASAYSVYEQRQLRAIPYPTPLWREHLF